MVRYREIKKNNDFFRDVTSHKDILKYRKAERFEMEPATPTVKIWTSASSGDCGLSGCRCSPGLWISIAKGKEGISLKWGEPPFDRGSYTYFTDEQHDDWLNAIHKLESIYNTVAERR